MEMLRSSIGGQATRLPVSHITKVLLKDVTRRPQAGRGPASHLFTLRPWPVEAGSGQNDSPAHHKPLYSGAVPAGLRARMGQKAQGEGPSGGSSEPPCIGKKCLTFVLALKEPRSCKMGQMWVPGQILIIPGDASSAL